MEKEKENDIKNVAPEDLNTLADEIRQFLSGNLCRCSGYEGQLRGIRAFLNSRNNK